jgi:hypothetical protein
MRKKLTLHCCVVADNPKCNSFCLEPIMKKRSIRIWPKICGMTLAIPKSKDISLPPSEHYVN